jgi:asparaginyl-tRNA synthetase
MRHTKVKDLLNSTTTLHEVNAKGWVRTFRNNQFIALNDGSTINNIQCVVDFENTPDETLRRVTTGAAISVTGTLVESKGAGQQFEIQVSNLEILGDSDAEKFPIQPKNKPSLDFLRENAHLRVRTNMFGAIMRVRSVLSFAVHSYFQEKGFVYVNTPIITGSDAEGAGEMFKVTALPFDGTPRTDDGKVNYKEDFFGKETNLTVSGQLEGETFAMALGQIYTFGPTFRAENSNTSRHLAEFWMIEPEVAFNDLNDNMDLAEDFIQYVIKYVLDKCTEDLKFLEGRLLDEEKSKPQAERSEMALMDKLNFVLENNFKCPVILFDYPANIKAFYMRLNEDGKTVRAMDILFPGIGEIVGGSQREERFDVLVEKMKALGIDEEELWWYLDTRRFGSAVHSGFGLGFERLVLFVTGMTNIRDVIPFPRTPMNAEF